MDSRHRLVRLLVRVWMCGALNVLLACGIAVDAELLGTLTLPVVIDGEGATYRLHGAFAVRAFGADAGVVRRIETDAGSDAPTLELRLSAGDYSVLLEPGWTLARVDSGGDRTVAAELVSANPLVLSVDASQRTTASFRMQVEGVVVATDDSVLEIEVEVSEARCGNGVVELGEVCDDGARDGGQPTCDRSCLFTCDGACPLRVDPTAKTAGDGSSWDAPLTDLHAALERPWGELWVRGGDFRKSSDPETVTLKGVGAVLGGFDGTERTPAERLPTTPRTSLPGIVVDGQAVLLDRVSIGHPPPSYDDLGTIGLDVKNADDIRLIDVDIRNAFVTLASSRVRFERVDIELPFDRTMNVTRTYLAWSGGSFGSSSAMADGVFADSRVMLQNLYLRARVEMSGDADGLVVGCRFDRGGGLIDRTSGTVLRMARGIIIDSTFVGGLGAGSSPVDGGKLFVWNSSFVNLTGSYHRSAFPQAGAVSADELEIAVSSFYQNTCNTFGGDCGLDVHGAMRVTASLFVQEDPWRPLGTPPVDPIIYSVQSSAVLTGNCYTYARSAFTPDPSIDRPLLALHHPCPDLADATELEHARKRLMQLVEPYRVPFYDPDVARYSAPDWWRHQTVLAGHCTDEGEPDPGAHHVLPCPGSPPRANEAAAQ